MNVRAAALLLALAGCSFVFVRGASDADNLPHDARVECTNSDLWPMIDGLFVGANALGLTLVAESPAMQRNSGSGDTLMAVTIAGLFVHTISAIYGFIRTSECQEALQRASAAQRRYRFRIVRPEPPAPPPQPVITPASAPEEGDSTPDAGQP
jgi:hypothetical protein